MKKNMTFLVWVALIAFGFGPSLVWANHDYILIGAYIDSPNEKLGEHTMAYYNAWKEKMSLIEHPTAQAFLPKW